MRGRHTCAAQRDRSAEGIRRRDECSGSEDVQQLRTALRETGDVIGTGRKVGCKAEVPRTATVAVPDRSDRQSKRIGCRIRDAGGVVIQAEGVSGR